MYKKRKKNVCSRENERIEKAARNNAKDLIWQIAIFFILFSDIDTRKRETIVVQGKQTKQRKLNGIKTKLKHCVGQL